MVGILIFGSGGQLGHELLRTAWPPGYEPVGLPRLACDIADAGAVGAALHAHRPSLAVNAAAYTAVDRAETDREASFRTNGEGPGILGAACAAQGIPLIHISTDYVFDGSKNGSYDEADPIAPLGHYGTGKAAGESALRAALDRHVILRTSWLFGAHGPNFVKTMLRLAREREELAVVADQHGTPTPADALAGAIAAVAGAILSGRAAWGTYHYAGAEPTTWHGLASATIEEFGRRTGRSVRVRPITTAEYPTPVRRPANSALDCARIGRDFGIAAADWRAGLHRVLDELLM
ncbi:MAG TPA: dTDP-4-dehydrorhamnose reductase [Aliidongia sp.]|nr:dTDP-4-dehydrorhamnose reductase [Aliidongia sp.]